MTASDHLCLCVQKSPENFFFSRVNTSSIWYVLSVYRLSWLFTTSVITFCNDSVFIIFHIHCSAIYITLSDVHYFICPLFFSICPVTFSKLPLCPENSRCRFLILSISLFYDIFSVYSILIILW